MRIDHAKFKYELARREMKQRQLAEKSGVSMATLSAISGGKTIAPATADKVANALNVPVERLLAEVGA